VCYCLVCITDHNTHRVTSTKCHKNIVISPDDDHIVARNMYSKEINILRKVVHEVGFIYKIIQGYTARKLKKNGTELFEGNGWRIWNYLKGNGCSLKSGTWKIFAWREWKIHVNLY
jgi:hypothetical protein